MARPGRYTKDAIEIMFAWHQGGDDLALERLQWYVERIGGDPIEGLRELMSGMINVCGKSRAEPHRGAV